ncbi:MAG: Rrf2 family transcriptional regulator [Candidatus Limivivens sp.]|nr:Rrf2 family transcriptional regulator [Candidatus Limivivens sp.]
MKISTKGRYGLRAMIDMALYSEEETVSISSIAARQQISESYLEQLVAKLKKAGLVVSSRGAQGGYRLAKPAGEISVGDILRALEGSLDAVECPGLQEESGCETADFCVAKYVWKRINDSITKAVDDIDLSQLVEESRLVEKKSQNIENDHKAKTVRRESDEEINLFG